MKTDSKFRQFNWYNFWVCWLVSLGQIAFGYPASIIGTTLGEPSFLIYMKLIDPTGNLTPNADQLIGAMSGVFQVSLCARYCLDSLLTLRLGWSCHWYHHRQLCDGQMGTKSRRYLLLILVSLWWSFTLRLQWLCNVHRRKILRWHGKLGFLSIQ